MNIAKHAFRSRQSGFTLLELLLVIGVSGILLLGLSQLTQSWINTETASGAGQHLQRVGTIVQRHIEANFDNLVATNDAIADADPSWDGLRDELTRQGLLTGPVLRSPLNVDLRITYNSYGAAPNLVWRAVIIADTPLAKQRVLDVARQAGNVGGTIMRFPDGTVTQARGAFGQWQIADTQLQSGGVEACTAINTDATTACLVAVVSFNNATLVGPYLYRQNMNAIETAMTLPLGTLNTMNTNLEMSGNNISGASDVETQNLDVSQAANLGTTTVNGPATFNSNTTVTNGLDVSGNMDVLGDATFGNNVTIGSGNLNTQSLSADMIQAPIVRTNSLDAQNLVVSGGSMTVDDSMTVNDIRLNGAGEVYANTVNAGNINAGDGEMKVGTMTVQNSLNITGTVNVTNGQMVVDKLAADKCVQIWDATASAYVDYGNCI